MSAKLEFNIRIRSVLIEERELEPFFVAYLTSDIRAKNQGVFASDSYHSRITSGRCNKIKRANQFITGERYGKRSYEWPQKIIADIELLHRGNQFIETDSAICIQVFCEVACGMSEWGCHTCGWCCAYLKDFATNAEIKLPLCDQGMSQIGARGDVTITLLSSSSIPRIETRNTPIYTPPSAKTRLAGMTSSVLSDYVNAIERVFSKYAVADSRIRVYRQPNYISCGGCVVRPPCAFLINPTIPMTPEYAYIHLLSLVLCRRSRGLADPDASESVIVQAFLDGRFDANENGAILMDMAMCMSNACTYLFDEVMKPNGTSLCVGEDFSRILMTMHTGDCEDFSHHALSILWDILDAKSSTTPGKWTTPAMQRLQQIRKNYVATIILKAVKRPSASWTSGGSSTNFAAHDCCDLVPLHLMSHMLTQGGDKDAATIIDNLASHRGISYDSATHKNLVVIIGEGTGRVSTHIHNDSDPSMAPFVAKDRVLSIFSQILLNIGGPLFEDYRKGSMFYLHALTAYVHDTLVDTSTEGWPVPQVIYLCQKNSTIGPQHTDYVVGNAIAIAAPAPSASAMSTMMQMDKFEFPIDDMPYVDLRNRDWINKSTVLRNRFTDLKNALMFKNRSATSLPPPNNSDTAFFQIGELCTAKRLVEINIPLVDLTPETIKKIETVVHNNATKPYLGVEDVVVEQFNVPGLATVSIIFSV